MFFDDFKRWRRGRIRDVQRLQQQLNEMLGGGIPFPDINVEAFPPINAWSNDEKLIVRVEMAGFSLEDIDVSIMHQTLTLKGNREAEELGERDIFHRQERGHGKFVRTIELPFAVNAEAVEASYTRGVLTLEMPRAEADKPRKISIKTE
jgi:HSP20 family protein